jgi:hypothetical protein
MYTFMRRNKILFEFIIFVQLKFSKLYAASYPRFSTLHQSGIQL